jgi:hypothetical protein
MSTIRRPFDSAELPMDAEAADSIAIAVDAGRQLERASALPSDAISSVFVEMVMASITSEPAPEPVMVVTAALRAGRLRALLAGFADAWQVATSGPRPIAARAQALALVLVALIALASTAGLAAGAAGLLSPQDRPSVAPHTAPAFVPGPSQAPALASPAPTRTPRPSKALRATEAVKPTGTADTTDKSGADARDTPEPRETEDSGGEAGESGDDHSGSGGGSEDPGGETSGGATPEPTGGDG